jgi:hypothetical protein
MLKAVCTQAEFDTLGDSDKAHYKQDGALFRLEVAPVTMDKAVYALEDVGGLHLGLNRLKTENKDLKTELAVLKTNFEGLDPEEAKTAIAKIKEIGDAGSNDTQQKELEAIKSQLTAQHTKKLTEVETRAKTASEKAERYLASIKKSKIREAAIAAIQGEKGSIKVLMPHVASSCRIVVDPEDPDNPDKFIVEVMDEKGEARFSMKQGAVGLSMSPAELVSEMKAMDEFSPAFEGARAAGSGASGSSQQVRTTGRTVRRSDQAAIEANIDRIAKGEVTVVD